MNGGSVSEEEMVIPWDDRVEEIRRTMAGWNPERSANPMAFDTRGDCVYLLDSLDTALELLRSTAPHLRTAASHCEDCEGSGEIVTGPNDEEATSEPCANCKPIWDLIERIEPKRLRPAAPIEEEEEEDDILF